MHIPYQIYIQQYSPFYLEGGGGVFLLYNGVDYSITIGEILALPFLFCIKNQQQSTKNILDIEYAK